MVLSLLLLLPSSYAALALNEPAPSPASASLPNAQIFAPGVISGAGNDGAPTFSPDGETLFFTRSAAHWTVIVESHKVHGQWTKPTLAPFSGEWPDSSPALSPDGSYIVFQSTRPASPAPASTPLRAVSNLWRVDRSGSGWTQPARLPDTVNIGPSIWKPSIAADQTIYFTRIDDKGAKRLFSSKFVNGAYQPAQPLSFSDGATGDVDPEVAPDQSFLVFCSSGRVPGDTKDHLFLARKDGEAWGKPIQIRYAGDDAPPDGFSTDDEPRLGIDHRTLYFSSDRVVSVHFPRSRAQAQQDYERLESWDNSNTNVWFFSISSLL